jgi:hypothetical protein
LLVQLEAALPSWLLNHVEVRYSFQSTEDEKTLRQWVGSANVFLDVVDLDLVGLS